MGYKNSKEEVIIDIESDETSNGAVTGSDSSPNSKQGNKKSLSKLFGGVLGFNDLGGVSEKTAVTADNGEIQSQELVPLVGKDQEKEKLKGGKAKKAPKPPRPPRGPSMDAADMRMVREIAKIATKKRERMEHIKALTKTKAEKSLPLSSSPSSLSKSSGGTISAMLIAILFFLVIIYQGFGYVNSPSINLAGAPQPAPETIDLISVELHYTTLSNDGAAPNSVSSTSRYTGQFAGSEFSSMG